MSKIKRTMKAFRFLKDVAIGIGKESKKEGKSMTRYLEDIHRAHCNWKYNRVIVCPDCNEPNILNGKLNCWNCKSD